MAGASEVGCCGPGFNPHDPNRVSRLQKGLKHSLRSSSQEKSTRSNPKSRKRGPSRRGFCGYHSLQVHSTADSSQIAKGFLSSGEPQTAGLGGGRASEDLGHAASVMPGGLTTDPISCDPLEGNIQCDSSLQQLV